MKTLEKSHTLMLFVAYREINRMMGIMDLREDGKWFAEMIEVEIKTLSKVNKKYIMNLIKKSKPLDDWICAVIYKGKFYHDPEVLMISNGKDYFFTMDPLKYYENNKNPNPNSSKS